MAKKDLSTMTDAEYKLLTPQELMAYNKSLPVIDYETPYVYKPFPKMKFKLETRADGSGTIVTAIATTAKENERFGKEWKDSPLEFGVETAPGAPEIPVQSFSIPVPAPEATGVAARS